MSKDEIFDKALEFERNRSAIIEISADEQWFIALNGKTIEELSEGGLIVLILFQKQSSSQVATIKVIYDSDKKELIICDFLSNIENKGFGSILLRNVIELGKQFDCKTITGKLSSVDYDHFDKLKHLYKKFKFEVNTSGDSGTIVRKLS